MQLNNKKRSWTKCKKLTKNTSWRSTKDSSDRLENFEAKWTLLSTIWEKFWLSLKKNFKKWWKYKNRKPIKFSKCWITWRKQKKLIFKKWSRRIQKLSRIFNSIFLQYSNSQNNFLNLKFEKRIFQGRWEQNLRIQIIESSKKHYRFDLFSVRKPYKIRKKNLNSTYIKLINNDCIGLRITNFKWLRQQR